MPTNTTHYALKKPVPGADDDIWGDQTNENWDDVDNLLFLRAIRTADKRNRFVNPAAMVSQENASTAGTASGYYGADQWQKVNAGTTGVYSFGRVAVPTPGGSSFRMRAIVTTADAAVAAGDVAFIQQNMEGYDISDLRWGSADAKPVMIRFGCNGPAGTYTACMRSASAPYKSYNHNFTISAGEAGTDIVREFQIPAETAGTTWGTFANLGGTFAVVLMAGTTWQGTNDSWDTGNFTGTNATSNFMATNGNTFELFDLGFHADPEDTGVAPPFELGDQAEEVARCMRYWFRRLIVVETNVNCQNTTVPVPMRLSPPAISGGGAGFSVFLGNPDVMVFYQTTRGSQTLTFNARM